MNKKTNWVAGSPILHSMSPALHNSMYEQLGINAVMQAHEYSDAKRLVHDIRRNEVSLTAITMPLKETVVQYLDQLSDTAKQLGLVNTIINQDGRLLGHNTDLAGIEYALSGIDLKNKSVLIIGAGAVAKICGHYLQDKAKNMYWLNRSKTKVEKLSACYGGVVVEEPKLRNKKLDMIINTSAVGMLSCLGLPINRGLIKKNQIIFDVIYNPLKTELLKEAEKKAALGISGLEMFIFQALEQIEIFQSEKIITKSVLAEARNKVKRGLKG